MSSCTSCEVKDQTNTAQLPEWGKRYQVILLNDDVTTMDFVVMILLDVFLKSFDDAVELMFQIHYEGMGIAGVYVKEIAEAKQEQVRQLAAAAGFPLRCTLMQE
ncbi:MAG TPA: ATP-dependent Clp protease adaptor ClpS [Candidatus Hydrogenedentes bacterium]|nr:ATP-dependent Clp protease adaptor ClpS [Candidatus Hydrogenedentota bacterium]HOM46892.1 ATP-dependent Clp protease adaptor ClpS [Candidatus Hydrogenedentota bacterium]HOR50857.1 ATP-dependent Clp protease adaptor ClpS [Candidatus Hydrogenedentota bacterium]HPK25779.1 ATP-dependent Clp protease adaptor ClpS [Candidatus Hydrogenedentota bacterium]HPX86109.1 ATP-dependent Clp protease adaptor ClpS [Candidatus Hydrogenedentota bacterium]